MVNPYFGYVAAFCMALIAYSFGWSDLYPGLTLTLVSFLVITIGICLAAGAWAKRSGLFCFTRLDVAGHRGALWLTAFIYGLWVVEFFHAGGIPVIKIISGQPYNYRIFGVPTFHVFVVTFSSFCTIFLFHLYLSRPSRRMLLLYVVNLSAAVLIYNRGMFFFNLTASACLFLVSRKKLSWQISLAGLVGGVVLLYGFGVLGSLRVSHEGGIAYSNKYFLDISGANRSFRESVVPDELFWSYIYLSSPLANLQHTVNTAPAPNAGAKDVAHWVNNELMFDFISKRVNTAVEATRKPISQIDGPFNASTIYSRSYAYLGWTGIVLMFIAIVLLPVLVLKILPKHSPFFLSGIAILNTMFIFMIFENTIAFTGLSFQLVYPVMLHIVVKKFPGCLTFLVNNKVTTVNVKPIQRP